MIYGRHERVLECAWPLFSGQYVTVLTPGYTSRAPDASGKDGRGWGVVYSGSAFPCEPRRPSSCTSHPVAGQRLQRSFLQQERFYALPLLCAFIRERQTAARSDWFALSAFSTPVHGAVRVDPVVRGFSCNVWRNSAFKPAWIGLPESPTNPAFVWATHRRGESRLRRWAVRWWDETPSLSNHTRTHAPLKRLSETVYNSFEPLCSIQMGTFCWSLTWDWPEAQGSPNVQQQQQQTSPWQTCQITQDYII